MEQDIESRPKCSVEGCNCIVRLRPKNKSGLVRYYSMCQKHQDAPTGVRYAGTPIVRECVKCGKSFPTEDLRKKFCSRHCLDTHKWKSKKKRISTECAVCEFPVFEALHLHHLAGKHNRNSSNKNDTVMLCSNCHYMLHNTIGRFTFNVLTKEQTIEIINKIRKEYGL